LFRRWQKNQLNNSSKICANHTYLLLSLQKLAVDFLVVFIKKHLQKLQKYAENAEICGVNRSGMQRLRFHTGVNGSQFVCFWFYKKATNTSSVPLGTAIKPKSLPQQNAFARTLTLKMGLALTKHVKKLAK
jgi:hypothetical protein